MSAQPHLPLDREDAVRVAVYLTRERGVTEADVLRALAVQQRQGGSFADVLLQLGLATAADVQAALGDREAAAISLPPRVGPAGRPGHELGALLDPFHPQAEHLRALRTELQMRLAAAGPVRALAGVAATAGDGNSRLLAELAVAFAQLGEPTLLIDADLRAPEQQQLFGLGERAGLTEALSKRAPVSFASVDGVPELTILTAGSRGTRPQELLASPAFVALLDDMRPRFRHILIDTPPLAHCSDALIVASVAGAAVTSARLDATPLPEYAELVRRLRVAGVRVLGGVVHAATPRT